MTVVDFTDVETTTFENLPRGRYLVNLKEIEEREGSEYPYLAMVFEVTEGSEEDHAGRKLFDNMSLSPKALWRLKLFLTAAGYSEEDLEGELELDPEDLLETEVEVQVKIQKGEDEVLRNRITRFMPA